MEFCGGTHIANTLEAAAFVVLEERAIAKGVRRIVAATGGLAQAAYKAGRRMADKLDDFEARASLDEADIVDLSKEMDATSMSAVCKADFRDRLSMLRKANLKKAKGVAKVATAMARAQLREAVAAAVQEGAQHCVVRIEGLDAKGLQQALQGLATQAAVLVLARSPEGNINCVAIVPESLQAKGFSADAWVLHTLAPLGGRGGGSEGRAQGSAPGSADVSLVEALSEASKYWVPD